MEENQTFQKAERSYEEMIESIKQNAVATIGQSIIGKVLKDENNQPIKNENGKVKRGPSFAPFLRHQEAENLSRAYNANTGASYSGINSLLLDIKKAEMGYETNQWVNTLQAQMLGATKEEIEAAKSKWQENSVKIHYIQTKERVPLYSDKPLLDKKTNQPRYLKDGSPAFEYAYEMVQKKDKDGNLVFKENEKGEKEPEMVKKQLFETKEIAPVLKEERLYNIANFPSIKQERIKALNPEIERMHIYQHSKKENAKKSIGVILEDIADKLHPVTREQIENYFKAQNFKKDYDVPQALNERQKEQVNIMVNEAIEKKNKTPKQEVTKAKEAEQVQKENVAQEQEQEKTRTSKTKQTQKGGRSR